MSKASARDGGQRIAELSDKMSDDDADFSDHEAKELLDRIVRRVTILVVARSGLSYEDVAGRLELAAKIARQMGDAYDDEESDGE